MKFALFTILIPDLPISDKPTDRCEVLLEQLELLEFQLVGHISSLEDGNDCTELIKLLIEHTLGNIEQALKKLTSPSPIEGLYIDKVISYLQLSVLAVNLYSQTNLNIWILNESLVKRAFRLQNCLKNANP